MDFSFDCLYLHYLSRSICKLGKGVRVISEIFSKNRGAQALRALVASHKVFQGMKNWGGSGVAHPFGAPSDEYLILTKICNE